MQLPTKSHEHSWTARVTTNFGIPSVLIMAQESHFQNHFLKEFARIFKIE